MTAAASPRSTRQHRDALLRLALAPPRDRCGHLLCLLLGGLLAAISLWPRHRRLHGMQSPPRTGSESIGEQTAPGANAPQRVIHPSDGRLPFSSGIERHGGQTHPANADALVRAKQTSASRKR